MDRSILFSILNGESPRKLFEGAFSDISIDLQDQQESLLNMINKYGDFVYLANTLTDVQDVIKNDFNSWIAEMDQFGIKAEEFVKSYVSKHPDVTIGKLIVAVSSTLLL